MFFIKNIFKLKIFKLQYGDWKPPGLGLENQGLGLENQGLGLET